MDNESYVSPATLTKKFSVTSGTLRRWSEEGKIRCLRPNGNGRRIYNIEDIKKVFDVKEVVSERIRVCYARVSSSHQKEDLERQIIVLKQFCPGASVIKDIGSGLNWKRHGFNSLLEQIYDGNVKEVVVTYRDRICRSGFEIIEWIFKKFDVKLVVLSSNDDQKDIARELSEDLLAITTVFVARNNGLRAVCYRRERKLKAEQEKSKASIDESEIQPENS